MSDFEDQYYFLFPPTTANSVLLKPDKVTRKRPFVGLRLPPGKPLGFETALGETLGIGGTPAKLDDVLDVAGSFAFRDHLRSQFEEFEIQGLQFYPMIITDGSRAQFL